MSRIAIIRCQSLKQLFAVPSKKGQQNQQSPPRKNNDSKLLEIRGPPGGLGVKVLAIHCPSQHTFSGILEHKGKYEKGRYQVRNLIF